VPIHKLTAAKIKHARKPGMLCDGNGLYIKVKTPTGKSGVHRFKLHGRSHWMGLGSCDVVSLAEMRDKVRENRKLLMAGINPLAHHKRAKMEATADAARTITFAQATELYIRAHSLEWRSPKHRRQWESSLARFAYPVLGAVPVGAVDDAMVLRVLEPIWITKSATASRLRQGVEAILDWAKARKYRSGENPARWKGHLDHLLAKRNKTARVRHQPSLPPAELPEFMARLQQEPGVAAQALQFLVLSNPRSGDLVGQWDGKSKSFAVTPMLWRHVDLKRKVWTIPVTKTDREFRIPLPSQAIEILGQRAQEYPPRPDDRVFLGLARDDMLKLLTRLGHGKDGPLTRATVHGFRATFRTWCDSHKRFHDDVVEAAMSHKVKDAQNTGSYRRDDFLEQRRPLMQSWADFATGPALPASAEVITLRI
jgi:integrase